MKTKIIRAKKGETLDYIAYREVKKLIEVIQLNPDLAHKFTLEANDKVYIPLKDTGHAETKKMVRLFG